MAYFSKSFFITLGLLSIGVSGAVGTHFLLKSNKEKNFQWHLLVKRGADKKEFCGSLEGEKISSVYLCSTSWANNIMRENNNQKDLVLSRVKSNLYDSQNKAKSILTQWGLDEERKNKFCNNISERNGWTEVKCQDN